MTYKLVAFDLDGTLLDSRGEVPRETLALVQELKGRLWVTLATGRSLASALPYIALLGIAIPVVLYHGALVYQVHTQNALRVLALPTETALRALALAREFPVDVQIYRSFRDPKVYVSEMSAANRTFARKENLEMVVTDLEEVAKDAPLKLLLLGQPEVLPAVAQALRRELPDANVIRSERDYLEVLPRGASKGEALAWLCRSMGIHPQEVVAVGDQESDLSMITWAGLGVAMAHAPKEVQALADEVIPIVRELRSLLV